MLEISKKRHLLKTITWRLVATTTTILLAWIISEDYTIGLKVGFLEFFAKMLLYYFHERVWYRFKFGVKKS